MAVIWQRRSNGRHYEVRSAGRSRRLYTDGVFHSQFNPRTVMSGAPWDLLTLPAFLRSAGVHRVLLLGLGGGAVARQLLHFFPQADITGVDLDAVHLSVARRFFGLSRQGVTLVQADARQFVAEGPAATFDCVIDDLFGGHGGDPVRAVPFDRDWRRALTRLLVPGGVLVANFTDVASARAAARLGGAPSLKLVATLPQYENRVLAWGGERDLPALKRHLRMLAEIRRHLDGSPGYRLQGPQAA